MLDKRVSDAVSAGVLTQKKTLHLADAFFKLAKCDAAGKLAFPVCEDQASVGLAYLPGRVASSASKP
ncbi:MAG: hypothetical protein UZ17_ACD001001805 [Acidobacteria bacterium OLB17]|nr:MAG: hypothetical protein UZ17_ACD001001805 [Acidobacteria bacterium OLB17]